MSEADLVNRKESPMFFPPMDAQSAQAVAEMVNAMIAHFQKGHGDSAESH